jgi:hypothetical protein
LTHIGLESFRNLKIAQNFPALTRLTHIQRDAFRSLEEADFSGLTSLTYIGSTSFLSLNEVKGLEHLKNLKSVGSFVFRSSEMQQKVESII